MFHIIEFEKKLALDVRVSWNKPLERVSMSKGTRVAVQLRPYVKDTDDGFVEMADLTFEDGSAAMTVPFAWFSFVE